MMNGKMHEKAFSEKSNQSSLDSTTIIIHFPINKQCMSGKHCVGIWEFLKQDPKVSEQLK